MNNYNMATQKENVLAFSTATRQLNALVRKYNQATRTSQGFRLDIKIDKQEQLYEITYTLLLRNYSEDAWEVRISFSLLLHNLQQDFTQMVHYMDDHLVSAITSRQTSVK